MLYMGSDKRIAYKSAIVQESLGSERAFEEILLALDTDKQEEILDYIISMWDLDNNEEFVDEYSMSYTF